MKKWQKAFEIATLKGCDAYIISNPINIRYLSGYRGEASIIVLTENSFELFTDFRCLEDAERESVKDCHVYEVPGNVSLIDFILSRLKGKGIKKVAFESRHVTYEFFEKLKTVVDPFPISNGVESLRKVKTEDEIEKIRKAGLLVVEGYEWLAENLKAGVSERHVEIQLEAFLKTLGAEERAFPFIIAAGENGAKPHARPSLRVIREGDCVVCDYGVMYDGYNVDVTRTFLLGRVSSKVMNVYERVRDVQEQVLIAIKPGVEVRKLHELSLKLLGKWGEFFKHSLGHGVGLEVHEAPRLSISSDEVLEEGMVITVEPGVYLRGEFGVRIEDTVVVRKDGVEILTPIPKEGVLCL
ncbi:MAG: aminopeptidase P family protein [Synergistetes bacterium]|nr:MAG: Peptidase M24 [bacterium 42_11]MBC7331914.1 aminopeptidase P family protein [Synergistota bacterium]MDK2871891.1 Xaa-Pro aminopeptidase [bacterium]